MTVGAQALEQLVELLKEAEGRFGVVRTERSVEIIPQDPDTYAVQMFDDGDEATVAVLGWHQHLDDPRDAVGCACGMLSPYYRVVEIYEEETLLKCFVERYEAAGWSSMGSRFLPLFRFRLKSPFSKEKRRRVEYQQAVIRPPVPWEEWYPGVKLDDAGLPVGSRLGRHEESL